MKIEFSKKNTINFSKKYFESILEKFVEIFTGKNFEKICQPKLRALKYFNYPELHEESTIFIIKHRLIQEIIKISGIQDFSLLDVKKPTLQKIKEIFIGITTFIKFKKHQLFGIKKFNKIFFFVKYSILQIFSNLQLIKKKIFFLYNNFSDPLICFKIFKTKKKKKKNTTNIYFLEFFLRKKKNLCSKSKNVHTTRKILERKKEIFIVKFQIFKKKNKLILRYVKIFQKQKLKIILTELEKIDFYCSKTFRLNIENFRKISFFFFSKLIFFLIAIINFFQRMIINFISKKKIYLFPYYKLNQNKFFMKYIAKKKQKNIKYSRKHYLLSIIKKNFFGFIKNKYKKTKKIFLHVLNFHNVIVLRKNNRGDF